MARGRGWDGAGDGRRTVRVENTKSETGQGRGGGDRGGEGRRDKAVGGGDPAGRPEKEWFGVCKLCPLPVKCDITCVGVIGVRVRT